MVRRTVVAPPVAVGTTPAGWKFLTNHTHVLLYLFRQEGQRLRDVANAVGIAERMVQRIVVELVEAGDRRISKEDCGKRQQKRPTCQDRVDQPNSCSIRSVGGNRPGSKQG
ncbi:MAG: hypothetical protein Q8K78_09410 [Planctomycetaceae bacterium]|nr:hypothetical protein [Planctomycetaceae bacterium]